jgi:Polysaccharide pyruvyl transferase
MRSKGPWEDYERIERHQLRQTKPARNGLSRNSGCHPVTSRSTYNVAGRANEMISHLGTFDVDNYGDLLYPIIFRHILKSRDASLQVRHYSPTSGEAPHAAGFKTLSIKTLFEPGPEPRTLVIGGGDILRTDWDVVASHYGTNSRTSYRSLRRSIGRLDALAYLWRRDAARLDPTALFANRFRSRWMNYPGAGPFLFDVANLPTGSSVSYLSCGVPHDFNTTERSCVKRILDQARFIYLRDEQSAEKLRRAGVEGKIHVSPDIAVTLSDQFDKEQQVRRGREILSTFGIDRDSSFLCFQCKPYPGFDEDEIISELRRYQERTGSAVVLLPIGYCHGDHKFLQSLSRGSGGTLTYANVHAIADTMSVISASELFVGTSLHGNITALSFGIPHLLGPLPVDKADGYLNVVNLPPKLKLRSWNELSDRIDMVERLRRDLFAQRATEAKQSVYQVIDQLLQDLAS